MNNQAAQTMPEIPQPPVIGAYYVAADMEKYGLACYAAALSQPAGVAAKWEVRRRFWDGAPWGPWESYETEAERTESFAQFEGSEWLHETRELYAAAPAASGGESPSGASVRERARELLATEYERANFPDVAKTIREGGYHWDSIRALELRALEQALTQQHALSSPRQEGDSTAASTQGLRELVQRWRDEADEIDERGWACNSNSIRARADELETLLTSPTTGADEGAG